MTPFHAVYGGFAFHAVYGGFAFHTVYGKRNRMEYKKIPFEKLKTFCEKTFEGHGFTAPEAAKITEILLSADLSGIESHGIQRLTRYHHELTDLGYVVMGTTPEIVKETPVSATIDGHDGMGQLISDFAMKTAIRKAKTAGIGLVAVRNSNHYGIAGYYARMAADEGLIGIAMTNTESIMVPTFGREPVLGTNPIAFAMPASPVDFCFDSATTVVPRGKLEVYVKRGNGLPLGWAVDENGKDSDDADRVLKNIITKAGGGILPLGGSGDLLSGYKGYGFGLICEICSGILSEGALSTEIARTPGPIHTSHFFAAIDYGMFGDKKAIEERLSGLLEYIRNTEKAEGCDRIYIHGEKETEAKDRILREGIPVNEKTYTEMKEIAAYAGTEEFLPEW